MFASSRCRRLVERSESPFDDDCRRESETIELSC
jgi:hypothetical protein